MVGQWKVYSSAKGEAVRIQIADKSAKKLFIKVWESLDRRKRKFRRNGDSSFETPSRIWRRNGSNAYYSHRHSHRLTILAATGNQIIKYCFPCKIY